MKQPLGGRAGGGSPTALEKKSNLERLEEELPEATGHKQKTCLKELRGEVGRALLNVLKPVAVQEAAFLSGSHPKWSGGKQADVTAMESGAQAPAFAHLRPRRAGGVVGSPGRGSEESV